MGQDPARIWRWFEQPTAWSEREAGRRGGGETLWSCIRILSTSTGDATTLEANPAIHPAITGAIPSRRAAATGNASLSTALAVSAGGGAGGGLGPLALQLPS